MGAWEITAYRLTTADYSGMADDELFTYDKVGNRKTYTKGSLTASPFKVANEVMEHISSCQ